MKKEYRVTMWQPCEGWWNVAYAGSIVGQGASKDAALDKAQKHLEQKATKLT